MATGATDGHLQMNQAALQSSHNRLGAIFNIQAHENRAHMAFYRSLGNAEKIANVLVAISTDEEMKHLQLPGA